VAASQPLPVAVAGAGRMGGAVADAVEAATDLTLVGVLERHPAPVATAAAWAARVVTDPDRLLPACRVLIDFTVAGAAGALAGAAARHGCGFVSGTTALTDADQQALDEAAVRVPVLHAANMSRGIALLTELVARAAAALGDFDVEIVERHHRHKRDAPSGTALSLAEAIRGARTGEGRLVHGRHHRRAVRTDGEIGIHALRGGDWIGAHAVELAGAGESLSLAHRAESRAVFVHGALACARFVVGRAPGRYTLGDVLGAER